MKKTFYITWEYLCNVAIISTILMVAYLGYLCYHLLRFWFSNVR